MNSDNDPLHQSDMLHKQPPLKEKKSNPIWKVIITLSILNIVAYTIALGSGYIHHVGLDKIGGFYIFLVAYTIALGSGYIQGIPTSIGVLVLFIMLLLIPLAIINIISILTFLITHRPEVKSRIISYVFLAVSIYILIVLFK